MDPIDDTEISVSDHMMMEMNYIIPIDDTEIYIGVLGEYTIRNDNV